MSNKLHSEKRIKSVTNITSSTDGDPVLFEDGDIVYDLNSQSFKKKSGGLGGGSWAAAVSSTSGPLNDISDVSVAGLSAADVGNQLTWSNVNATKDLQWRTGTTVTVTIARAGYTGPAGNAVAINFNNSAGSPDATFDSAGTGTLTIKYEAGVTTATAIKSEIDNVSGGGFSAVITGTPSDTAVSTNLTTTNFAGGAFAWKSSAPGAGGSVTNLTYTAATKSLASSTGNTVVLPEADGTNAGLMSDADKDKLDLIEAQADVTDTANVTAAGALMDSELAGIAHVKSLNQSVDSGADPSFGTANMTDATNKRFVTDAQVGYLVPMGSGNSYAQGLVLAGNATHNNQFLRKDGTWQAVSSNFTGLTDTPSGYASSSGDANKFLRVNGSGNGIVFSTVNIPANISDLGDVDAIGSNANRGKFLKVKSGSDAVEYTDVSIGDLSDVDLGGNGDTKILAYNNSNNRFEPVAQPVPGIANVFADTSPRLGGNLICDDGSGENTNVTGAGSVKNIQHVKEITFRGINSTTHTSGVKLRLTANARAFYIDMGYGKAERDHDNNAVVIGAKAGNSTGTDEDLGNNVSQLMSDAGKSLFLRSSFTGSGSAIQINHGSNNIAANATGDREGIEFRMASDGTDISSVSLKPYKLNTTTAVDNGKVPDLRFYNQHGNYIALKAPLATTSSASYTFTLPPDDGDASSFLITDGNGSLTWSNELALRYDAANRSVLKTASSGDLEILHEYPNSGTYSYLMFEQASPYNAASTVATSGTPVLVANAGNNPNFLGVNPTAPVPAGVAPILNKYYELQTGSGASSRDIVKVNVSSIGLTTTLEFYYQLQTVNFGANTSDDVFVQFVDGSDSNLDLDWVVYKQSGSSWVAMESRSDGPPHTNGVEFDPVNEGLTDGDIHWIKVEAQNQGGNNVNQLAALWFKNGGSHLSNEKSRITNLHVVGAGDAASFALTDEGVFELKQEQAVDPAAPPAGDGGKLYAKPDGKLYFRSNTGTYNLTATAGSQPGHILAYDTDGHNTTNQEYAVTTSFAVFNTNHVCTFNAPASGDVLVEAQVYVECQGGANADDTLELSLSTGTSYAAFVPGSGFTGVEKIVTINTHNSVDTPDQIVNCSWMLKSIGSGSKTIYLAAKSNNASAFKIKYGNEYPDLIMKVTQL